MKCKYCEKEMVSGLTMHEKYCKSRPVVAQEAPEQEIIIEAPKDMPIMPESPIKRAGLLSGIFKAKVPALPRKVQTVEELISSMPLWGIKASKPMFVGADKKRKLIQFVGVSKLKPPVMAWVFWDGIFISVEDRLYQPPHDIRGDVFFYDLDNSRPLLDNVQVDEETHESLRMAQVKNIAYAMGRIAGAQDLLKNLGLILIGIGIVLLISIANLYMTYKLGTGIDQASGQIGNITRAVQDYMLTTP